MIAATLLFGTCVSTKTPHMLICDGGGRLTLRGALHVEHLEAPATPLKLAPVHLVQSPGPIVEEVDPLGHLTHIPAGALESLVGVQPRLHSAKQTRIEPLVGVQPRLHSAQQTSIEVLVGVQSRLHSAKETLVERSTRGRQQISGNSFA